MFRDIQVKFHEIFTNNCLLKSEKCCLECSTSYDILFFFLVTVSFHPPCIQPLAYTTGLSNIEKSHGSVVFCCMVSVACQLTCSASPNLPNSPKSPNSSHAVVVVHYIFSRKLCCLLLLCCRPTSRVRLLRLSLSLYHFNHSLHTRIIETWPSYN